MGYIKEPEGIAFVVEPSILTQEDKLKISRIIANYKQESTVQNKLQNPAIHGRAFVSSRRKKTLK